MNQIKSDIVSVLSEILGLSDFAYESTIADPPNPGLFIQGHGTVGLPLSKHDADVIISKSKQSPYGKGADTFVDTSVRKSWELNPSQFSLRNPEWTRTIDNLLSSVYKELQLSGGLENVTAELYKLLLYEEGAFFKPHRDSEKSPGMFGTLVVCLPSPHRGGDVVLTHSKDLHEFKTAPHSDFGMSFAAWYSDVLHEVKPVTSGHRLVLTYNLIRRKGAPIQVPPSMASYKDRLVKVLERYRSYADKHPSPPYLVHKLEHQYSEKSLRSDLLKGADLGQTRCLEQAATERGFGLYLAIMERKGMKGDDDGWYDPKPWGLKRIVTMGGSRLENMTSTAEWFKLNNKVHILDPAELDERHYDRKKYTGYVGNEGCYTTYWYRDTALVLVPPAHRARFLYHCYRQPSKLLSWTRQLRQRADSDPSAKLDLTNLCRLKLEAPGNLFFRGDVTSEVKRLEDQTTHELVVAAVQCNVLDLYDRLRNLISGPMLPEGFQRLGGVMALTGQEDIQPRIDEALKKATSFTCKHEALKLVENGFLNAPVRLTKKMTCAFNVWLATTLAEVVMQSTLVNKADGGILADIIESWEPEPIQEVIALLVQSSNTAVKVTFANRLMAVGALSSTLVSLDGNDTIPGAHMSESDRQEYSQQIITDLWNHFRLESPPADDDSDEDDGDDNGREEDHDDDHYYYDSDDNYRSSSEEYYDDSDDEDDDDGDDDDGDGDDDGDDEDDDDDDDGDNSQQGSIVIDRVETKKYDKSILTGTDLANLIHITINMNILTEDEIRQRLLAAVAEADQDTCMYTLLPFVKLILEQKVPCYQLGENRNEPDPESICFVTQTVEHYIRTCVGKEPKKPAGSTRPKGRCRENPCTNCRAVHNFLADPKKKIGQFPCGEARLAHLDQNFPNTRNTAYDIDTIRTGKPNVWQMTKTDTLLRYRAWKAAREVAMQRVNALMDAGPPRSYLGKAADALLSFDVAVIEKREWEAQNDTRSKLRKRTRSVASAADTTPQKESPRPGRGRPRKSGN